MINRGQSQACLKAGLCVVTQIAVPEELTLEHGGTTVVHDGSTLRYDGVTFDLTLKG